MCLLKPRGATAVLIGLSVLFWSSAICQADIKYLKEDADGGILVTYQMTVTPADVSTPLLKHRLLLDEREKQSGNSVPFVHRALQIAQQTYLENRDFLEHGVGQGGGYTDLHSEVSTRDLDKKQLREVVQRLRFGGLKEQLFEAAKRTDCDWDWKIHDLQGEALVGFLLEEHQESRNLSRLLSLLACQETADREYDQALETMRLHTELVLDMATPEFLVCRLVAVAEFAIMNEEILRLMSSPLSPNLYWALSELPQPLVSMRDSLRFELTFVPRVLPILQTPLTKDYSPQRWQIELETFLEQIKNTDTFLSNDGGPFAEAISRLVESNQLEDVYPRAKARLLATGDKQARLAEELPAKAILVDAAREYRRVSDALETWTTMPFPEFIKYADRYEQEYLDVDKNADSYGALLAAGMAPALKAVRQSESRLARDIAAMRIIEAVRMHAARAGTFPETLAAVTCVPVPLNPSTGHPFAYRLEDGVATLDLPLSDGHPVPKQFILQQMGGKSVENK